MCGLKKTHTAGDQSSKSEAVFCQEFDGIRCMERREIEETERVERQKYEELD